MQINYGQFLNFDGGSTTNGFKYTPPTGARGLSSKIFPSPVPAGVVNPRRHFDSLLYTGNGSSGATIGHNLGVVPDIIVEQLPRLSKEKEEEKHSPRRPLKKIASKKQQASAVWAKPLGSAEASLKHLACLGVWSSPRGDCGGTGTLRRLPL